MSLHPAVVSLADLTGNMVRPWAEAGCECWCVDVQHSIRKDRMEEVGAGLIHYVWGDMRSWSPPPSAGFRVFVLPLHPPGCLRCPRLQKERLADAA